MDRRKFTRILFSCQATLSVDEQTHPIKVIDLSLNGALIELPPELSNLDKLAMLKIALDDEATINMEVSAKHKEENQLGLHCEHLDLDSATHLRRLVELNVGDEEILHRELSQLGN